MKAFVSWSSGKDCMYALYRILKNPENKAACLLNMSDAGNDKGAIIDSGVFGDIYLQEHRTWIERVCCDTDISAVFPLWGADRSALIGEFVADGFKAITVFARKQKLPQSFTGRLIDNYFLTDMHAFPAADPSGENNMF